MRRTIHALRLLALFVPLASLLAQPPDTVWTRVYGGDREDLGMAVEQTQDGGYIVVGSTMSYGAGVWDFYLLKTDANGDTLWTRTYGMEGWQECTDVVLTSDGGYALAGVSDHGAGGWDFWLVKTDENGDSLWSRTYGGTGWDQCYGLAQALDGGYLLVGYTCSYGAGLADMWLVKTDDNGEGIWSRTYGGPDQDACASIQRMDDGGYVLAGSTASFGAGRSDFWLIKTDANGDSLWSRRYGTSNLDVCSSVRQTSDGGYILAGVGGNLSPDFWLVKTDSIGNCQWSHAYGGPYDDHCASVRQTTDGGYILAGYRDFAGDRGWDVWLVRVDTAGDTVWTQAYDRGGDDDARDILHAADGGYLMVGSSDTTFVSPSYADVWLIKTAPELSFPWKPVPRSYRVLQVYPNPFNSVTTLDFVLPRPSRVSIRAYDVLGRDVGTISNAFYPSGRHTILWQCPTCASGTYWISMTGDGFHLVRKAILLR